MSGQLHLRADEPPLAEIYGDVAFETDQDSSSAHFPQSTPRPAIRVDLARGEVVLLLQCTLDVIFPGHAIIHAVAAVIRGRMPTAGRYMCIGARVQITGSDAVIAPPPIGQLKMPMGAVVLDEPLVWSVTERLPRSIEASDADATVSAQRAISWSPPTGWSYRVSFSPVIEIKLAEPIDLDTLVNQWIEPLRRVISLSTGRSERVTFLEVRGTEEPDRRSNDNAEPVPVGRQVYGASVSQNPYASEDTEVRNTKLAFNSWGEGATTLLALCRAWQQAETMRHPLIETLGTLLFIPKLHPRPRYLLFVQALEGLHGHDYAAARQQRQQTHTNRYASAVADMASCASIDDATKRFIKGNLMRKPIESLDPALRSVVQVLPTDLTTHFAELTLVADVLATDSESTSDWASALRVVRNGLSHGTRDWPRDELEAAADLLEVVARAHLMRLIGCPDGAITAWLTEQDLG